MDKFDPEQLEPDPPRQFDIGEEAVQKAEDLVPEAPDTEQHYSDADPRLRNEFWKLVLLYKFAIMGLALGACLVVFGVDVSRGSGLFALSLGVFGYATLLARRVQSKAEAGTYETVESDGATAGEDVVEGDDVNERTDRSDTATQTLERPE